MSTNNCSICSKLHKKIYQKTKFGDNVCGTCYSRFIQRDRRKNPVVRTKERQKALAYHYAHREERLNKIKIWQQKNASKRRLYSSARLIILKDKAYSLLGEICKRCGFSDRRALQIDHINGNGNYEKITTGTRASSSLYLRIINSTNYAQHYQILCANCNWIKRFEQKDTIIKRKPYRHLFKPKQERTDRIKLEELIK